MEIRPADISCSKIHGGCGSLLSSQLSSSRKHLLPAFQGTKFLIFSIFPAKPCSFLSSLAFLAISWILTPQGTSQSWAEVATPPQKPHSPISHSISGASLTFTAKIPAKAWAVLPKSSFPAGMSCPFLLAGPESQTPHPAAKPEANPTLGQEILISWLSKVFGQVCAEIR